MTNLYKYKNGIEIEIQEKSTILRVNGNEIKYKNSKDAFNFAKTYKSILEINKKYNIIYADPPWSYHVWDGDKNNRTAKSNYHTLKKIEIQNLPIQNICNENCVLFLWVTPPCLIEGLELIEKWGFNYKTIGFTWVKKNKIKDTWFWGMGYYTRANAELCLIGIKGKSLNRESKGVHQIIDDKIMAHSQKPDSVRNRIVELFGNIPRIELFARIKKEGWDVWGNETDKFN
jgi:N6-adenosine-specific RNA methylase IME4